MPTIMQAARLEEPEVKRLRTWVQGKLGVAVQLYPIAGGASTKKYYRITGIDRPIIAMVAVPPDSTKRYEMFRNLYAAAQVRVPTCFEFDHSNNFALIEDMGDELYATAMSVADQSAGELYRPAWETINRYQKASLSLADLPRYDNRLLKRELALFPEWYADKLRGMALDDDEANAYAKICSQLCRTFVNQPQLLTHRDYHSRNLFVCDNGPAVIDFNDSVVGPLVYDIASLLRDLYTSMDSEQEMDFLVRHWEHARAAGLPIETDFGEHYLRFELTSLQRLVKILGLFVRLDKQDGRPFNMAYLPKCEQMVHAIALRYRDLRPLALMVEKRIQ